MQRKPLATKCIPIIPLRFEGSTPRHYSWTITWSVGTCRDWGQGRGSHWDRHEGQGQGHRHCLGTSCSILEPSERTASTVHPNDSLVPLQTWWFYSLLLQSLKLKLKLFVLETMYTIIEFPYSKWPMIQVAKCRDIISDCISKVCIIKSLQEFINKLYITSRKERFSSTFEFWNKNCLSA